MVKIALYCLIFGLGLFVSFTLTTFLPLGEILEQSIQEYFHPSYCLTDHHGIDMSYPPVED